MQSNDADVFEDLELIEELSDADLLLEEGDSSFDTPVDEEIKDDAGVKSPMTTVTMAELFVSQGFLKRAFTIYRELLEADPDNAQLKARVYELKASIDEDNAAAKTGSLDRENGPVSAHREIVQTTCAGPGLVPGTDAVLATLEKWLHVIERRG